MPVVEQYMQIMRPPAHYIVNGKVRGGQESAAAIWSDTPEFSPRSCNMHGAGNRASGLFTEVICSLSEDFRDLGFAKRV